MLLFGGYLLIIMNVENYIHINSQLNNNINNNRKNLKGDICHIILSLL